MEFKDMSPGMKELYKLLLEGKIIHGGNPVLRWMAGNVVAEIDAAENIKPSKKKSEMGKIMTRTKFITGIASHEDGFTAEFTE